MLEARFAVRSLCDASLRTLCSPSAARAALRLGIAPIILAYLPLKPHCHCAFAK